jgi:hypothetical protein
MVCISLTSIPSRFKYLPGIVAQLLKLHPSCPVYVCIPDTYRRWMNDPVTPPDLSALGDRVQILRGKDYGPATKFIAPALVVPDSEIIVYVDDDTSYPSTLVGTLVNALVETRAVCGLSGFCLDEYFTGNVIRGHYKDVDIIEGYGGVCIQAKIIKNNFEELSKILSLTYNDDMALSNLLAKLEIPKKTVFLSDCHVGLVRQYKYGFEPDALHFNNGEGSHTENNKRIIQTFTENGCNYFK